MDYNLPDLKFDFKALQKILESNILLAGVVLLLVLKIISIGISVNLPGNIFFADITKSALENMANQTRQSVGLNALVENSKLDAAAEAKAEDMVKNEYFAHTSPSGITPWFWFLQAGYNYKYAGENLAIGFFDSQEVYNAWLNSPEHKANLLNPNYKEIGTAVLAGYGNSNSIVVVQLFGSQQTAKVPAKASAVAKNTNNKPVAVQPVTVAPVAKVLSQSTEAKIEPATGGNPESLYTKMLNYVIYDYAELLENITFGVALIVIGILIFLIFFSFNFQFEKKLVLRSILMIAILSFSLFVNKEMVNLFIPHQILV